MRCKTMKQDYLIFRKGWMASIDAVPTEKAKAELALAILRYAFDGTPYEGKNAYVNAVLPAVFSSIDATKRKIELGKKNGKKGGSPLLTQKRVNPTDNGTDKAIYLDNKVQDKSCPISVIENNSVIDKVIDENKHNGILPVTNSSDEVLACARARRNSDIPLDVLTSPENRRWLEAVCMNTRVRPDEIDGMIAEFGKSNICNVAELHEDTDDLKRHFYNWLAKRQQRRTRVSDREVPKAPDYEKGFE